MRILMIITRGDELGGAQTHVHDLATYLTGAGHTVAVIAGSTGPLTGSLAATGIETFACPELIRNINPAKDLRAVSRITRIIHRFQPDVVAAHSSKAGLVGRLAARRADVPCVFTAHGWAFTEGVPAPRRRIYRTIERLAATLASTIICVSEYDRRIGIAAGIPAARLVTVHNGVPDVPLVDRSRPGGGGPVRIVMVGGFRAQKDQQTLLRAVHGLGQVHLDLVGDGPAIDQARRLVDDLDLTNRVTFLGNRSDVPAVLARAHVFALSTNWEGFPLSTLEAMRSGLPAVVTEVGGVAEAVSDGETGFLVPRGDVSTLHDRLAALVNDPERREAMGRAARLRYESAFTVDRMVGKTLDVYRSVTARAIPVPPACETLERHHGI